MGPPETQSEGLSSMAATAAASAEASEAANYANAPSSLPRTRRYIHTRARALYEHMRERGEGACAGVGGGEPVRGRGSPRGRLALTAGLNPEGVPN